MTQSCRSRAYSACSILFSFLILFAGFSSTAKAQYYPAPPPPPPPNYPPPNYPPPNYPPPNYPPPSYPPQRGPQRGPDYPGNGPIQYPRYYRQPYLSLYGLFSAGHYSGLGVGNGTPATQSGGMTALGGTFGGYVMYPSPGPINVGLDVRGIVENSANSTTYGNKISGGLIGLRVDGSDSRLPVVPYFQFEVGGVGTNSGTQRTRDVSFAYQAQFGADIPFASDQIAARVEYGAGQLTASRTNHTLQTFSIGIVVHLR